ncbi:MAG: crotonase/enoyl-CoA hydratase family protein [Holophagales bacterium]|nr:crotonase/enoyl-CoA hydratase family protein [Holophagales bacterium]MYG29052.1 crotonase/enoyl-CoA hydratase family protein [Holophagales bacterium]MYI80628.1 crotonase/enoyl-CoA hydratase family protein [Holophagales bacterium]
MAPEPHDRATCQELEDGVLTITLNRPERLNAFNGQMMAEMMDAFDRADADDNVRAIVVTGEGRGFCAGADLSSGGDTFARSNADLDDYRDGGGVLSLRIYALRKPIIAAINGPAVGVGITMTLPMDVRLASTEARMGFVFVRRGMVPEACSSYFLPRLVGMGRASEWALSGRVFPASEALEAGLVSRLLPPDELLPAARDLAREIAANTSPVSVAITRHMLWKGLDAESPMAAHRVESKGIYTRGRSDDAREGVTSFLEKRPAEFPMKVSSDMPPYFPWWEDEPF